MKTKTKENCPKLTFSFDSEKGMNKKDTEILKYLSEILTENATFNIKLKGRNGKFLHQILNLIIKTSKNKNE